MLRTKLASTPRWIGLAVAIAVAGAGCMSMGAGHPATPVPQGHVEVGGDLSGTVSPVFQAQPGSNDPVWVPMPNLAASARVGLAEPLDVGLRGSRTGLSADATLAVLQNSNHTLSLNPTYIWTWLPVAVPEEPCFSLFPCSNSTYPQLKRTHSIFANLLYDFYKSESWTATVGAKPGVRIDEPVSIFGRERENITVPMAGLTGGVRFGAEGLFYQVWGDAVGFRFREGADQPRSIVSVKLRGAVGYRF